MKCYNCGHEIKKQNQFCPECGGELIGQNKEKKPNGKKLILLFTPLIILTVAFSIFYFVGKEKFTPENIVQIFEEAVNDQDVKKLQDILTSSDDELDINKDNASIMMEFFTNNPEKLEDLIHKLNNQAKLLETDAPNSNSANMYGTINIKEDGNQWLLFDNYKLDMVPVYITLATEQKEIDLYIDDKKVATSSEENYEETFGPFMPGIHKLSAAFENKYTSTKIDDEINLFNMPEETQRHELEIPIAEVSINSLYNDYKLYINDQETDVTINEGENSIGVFPTDSSTSLYIQKEFPWGTVKSEEAEITSNTIQFNEINVLSKDKQLELMQQLNDTVNLYHEALTKRDASIYQDGVTNNMKEILADHLEFISDRNSKYEGKLVRAEYDNSKTTYPEYNEKLKGYTITLSAHYFLYEPQGHAYGNLSWLGRDLEKKQYKASKKLTIFYDEAESLWKLHHIEDEYFHISEQNKQVFEIDN